MDQEPPPSRILPRTLRQFLGDMLAVGAGVGVGCVKLYAELQGLEPWRFIKNLVQPQAADARILRYSGAEIKFNTTGIPESYLLPDGTRGQFDEAKALEIKQKAIQSGEPELLDILTTTEYIEPIPSEQKLPEHPVFDSVSDTFSKEELQQRGVEIIQPTKTQLSLRPGAFNEGEPIGEMYKNDVKLKIVLVDGPRASFNYVSSPAYPEDIARLAQRRLGGVDYTGRREREIQPLLTSLQLAQATLKAATKENNSDIREKATDAIVSLKSEIAVISGSTDAELKVMLGNTSRLGYAGQYVAPEEYQRVNPTQRNTAVVFVPVGLERKALTKFTLAAKPDGRFSLYSSRYNIVHSDPSKYDATPKAEHSCLNPSDLPINPGANPSDPNSYIVTPGLLPTAFISSHELNHYFHPSNEYETDKRALHRYDRAWSRWESSNFTDNGGYYLAFRLPQGGFILS